MLCHLTQDSVPASFTSFVAQLTDTTFLRTRQGPQSEARRQCYWPSLEPGAWLTTQPCAPTDELELRLGSLQTVNSQMPAVCSMLEVSAAQTQCLCSSNVNAQLGKVSQGSSAVQEEMGASCSHMSPPAC